MLKVLIVSENHYGALGWSCARTFTSLGCQVEWFDYISPFVTFGTFGLGRRVMRRLAQRPMNAMLAWKARQFQPDLVFITKGETIYYETLRDIKEATSALLFNWYPDSPFNMVNSSVDVIRSIPLFDCFFIWGKFLIQRLYENGAQRVEYLPFGYDPDLFHPVPVMPAGRARFTADVCFAGTWERPREEILTQIADFDLSVWGNMWEKVPAYSPLRKNLKFTAVYGEELSKIFGCSKIILNFIRAQNGDANNFRTFEVPGFGGFLLTTRTAEQCELFKEDQEIVCYSDVDELRDKIGYYLAHEDQRRKIAEAGHVRAEREHQLIHRLQIVLDRAIALRE